MPSVKQIKTLEYDIMPHPKGLGFVAEARDNKGRLQWRSNNHCDRELCATAIREHKARQVSQLSPVETVTFSDYHRKGLAKRQKGENQ